MSTTNSLHYQLCTEGAKWLRRRKRDWKKCQTKPCKVKDETGKYTFCAHCKTYNIVAVELNVTGAENSDVWGYDGDSTVMIEVKVSHADFLADQKKMWRNVEPYLQVGNRRWYLCPEGIIKPNELPDGWGLLYWDGKRIYSVVAPVPRMQGCHADMRILYSLMYREKMTNRTYDYRGRLSTIQSQTINGVLVRDLEKRQNEEPLVTSDTF